MVAQRGSARKTEIDAPSTQLEDIKRLLILLLLKGGVSPDEVGKALGVGQSTVYRMFPGVRLKKAANKPKK